MTNIQSRIEQAKANLRKAEQAKTVAETQKANAEEQLQEVVLRMQAAGVSAETISDEITKLETKIQEDLTKVERLIPQDV